VTSEHVLSFVLVFSSLDEKVMPPLLDDDQPIFVREIPRLFMRSQLITPRRHEPRYVVTFRKGASMEGFYRWNQDDILFIHYDCPMDLLNPSSK
jgi:hypothetical protein